MVVELEPEERRVFEAKRAYEDASAREFEAARELDRMIARTNELREEFLGLSGVLRVPKCCGHLAGLALLKQRVRAEYFAVRLDNRR